MEDKKLSELVAELENNTSKAEQELSESKATLIVNFGKDQKRNPVLLDGTEKSLLSMFIPILEFYVKKNNDTPANK